MNFTKIVNGLAQAETTDFERQDSRRNVLRSLVRGASLAALPLALSALVNKSQAQTTSNPIEDALNGYLLMEFLQEEFYSMALGNSVGSASPLIPSGLDQTAIFDIRDHATAHISQIWTMINSKGLKAIGKPKFDFTGGKGLPGGKYSDVFSNYDVFLALAQCFEDIAVRVYKGGLSVLQPDNNLLTTSMRLHTVEARHAAHIREMRRVWPSPLLTGTLKPWITKSDSNIADPDLNAPYAGEDNTLQLNIQIKDINGLPVSENAATEAFDEPQDTTAIAGFLDDFIITTP